MTEYVQDWTCKDIYVGCSGNYTVLVLIELFKMNMLALREGFLDPEGEVREKNSKHVPLASLLGVEYIPPATAAKIEKMIKVMQADKEIEHRYQVFDRLYDIFNQ